MRNVLIFFLLFSLFLPADISKANDPSFIDFTRNFALDLVKSGIDKDRIDRAFAHIEQDEQSPDAHDNQPEFRTSLADYVNKRVSESRIRNGREALARQSQLLKTLETSFQVDPYIVGAIWGLETSYGAILNNKKLIKPVLSPLINLAYRVKGKREFAFKQILTLFRMEVAGGKKVEEVRGSWAGAIGHTQFIPTTLHAYAVNGDDNPDIDLEASIPDALASTAYYLHVHGWIPDLPWGVRVSLQKGFDYSLAYHAKAPLSFWLKQGVRVPERSERGLTSDLELFLPVGAEGPAFLLTKNFHVIKTYNRSSSYAMSVTTLADALAGRAPEVDWPENSYGLTHSETLFLQNELARLGYYNGKVDGLMGSQTRKALIGFQKDQGLRADGHPSVRLMSAMGMTSGISKK